MLADKNLTLFGYVTVIKATIDSAGKWHVGTDDGTVYAHEYSGSRLGALQTVIALRKELETGGFPYRLDIPGLPGN